MSEAIEQGNNKPHKTLAILNCVVDQLYDAQSVNEANMENFLRALPHAIGTPGMETPRAGDTILLSQSQLRDAAAEALSIYGEFNDAAGALEEIFGRPKLAPGGSLANTVATFAHSQKDGNPIIDTTILTVLDEGAAGETFKKSYPDGVVLEDAVHGECLTVHVVPYDGDRSQFPTYSDTNPSHKTLSPYIAKHVMSDQFDSVYFEGFMADSPDFESDSKTLIWALGCANTQREMYDSPKEPIRLVVSAGAQHICNNQAFRDFVKEASKHAPISIHANTGEFRRLLDNDEEWRVEAEAEFREKGLQGRELEAAKKGSKDYRAAKTAANVDSVQKAMREFGADAKYDIEFVVTDGPNTAYVVNNDNYIEFTPEPLDPSTIVNKVGAGDAFMAFYRLARELGLSQEDSMKAGGVGATHTLQQEEARPKVEDTLVYWQGYEGPVKLLPMNGMLPDLDIARKLREFPYIGERFNNTPQGPEQ